MLEDLIKLSSPQLTNLNRAVEHGARLLIERSFKENVEIRITHGYRSISFQNDLYAQGRTKPGAIVTSARGGYSYHNYGLAIDFVLRKSGYDITADYDKDGIADWMEVVAQAKLLGFEWGGDWEKFIDRPHFQMAFGLSTAELRAGKKPTEGQINAAISKMNKIHEGDKTMQEIEVLRNKLAVQDTRIEALEKRLNINQKETYAANYTKAVEAAKASGLITTVADKSKIELNIIQMFHNAGLTNKQVLDFLKDTERFERMLAQL